MYPIQIGFVFQLYGGNLLSNLGASPAKMQNSHFIAKKPETLQKPCEIHVPNSDWICFRTFRGEFAKHPGRPFKNAKKQFHKQNPEKASQAL